MGAPRVRQPAAAALNAVVSAGVAAEVALAGLLQVAAAPSVCGAAQLGAGQWHAAGK